MATAFIGTHSSLLVAHRTNGQWQVRTSLEGMNISCVAADPEHPERVYCGTLGQGLWCSGDGGASWYAAGPGIGSPHITSVAVSRAEQEGGCGTVYAGTGPTGIYRSEDGGATWQDRSTLVNLPSASTWSFPPRPGTHHARWIALDPHHAGRLWVSAEAGATVRSDDAGETWVDRDADTPYDAHTVRTHLLAPGRLYAAAGDGFMQPGHGYLESRDGGASWQPGGEGMQHHYLWGLAVDPGDPDTFVVSASAGPPQAHSPVAAAATVYRKSASQPWREVQPAPAGGGSMAYSLAANATEPGIFYAVSNRGLFRSPDAGQIWEQQSLGPADDFLVRGTNCLEVVDLP